MTAGPPSNHTPNPTGASLRKGAPDMTTTCRTCGKPAPRHIEYPLYAPHQHRTTEPFCAAHGDWLLADKRRRPVQRPA